MAFGITTFSEAPFAAEGSLNADVAVTGVQLTTNIGAATTQANANVNVTGIQLNSFLGDETIVTNTPVDVTGSELNTNVGSVTATAGASASPTGSQLNFTIGTFSISAGGNVSIIASPESEIELAVGSVTTQANADVDVNGSELSGAVGDVDVTGNANVDVTGEELTTVVDDVTTIANANIDVTGVSASVSLPSPLVFTGFGDAQISTAQSKFGGASLLLDGTGDYLESEGAYNFAGDPFTIDMWVRPTSGTQDAVFFDSRDSLSNNAIALRQASDNLLVLRANGTLFNINNVFSANTWVHIAVTRGDPFGNTYSVFVNGVKQDSTLFGVTASAASIHIGSDFNGSNNWEGYIDELRVADVDEYGGTDFTPPTSAYTADGNVPILLHFDGANGSTTFTNSGFVDSVTITADANIDVIGQQLLGALGEETIDINTPVDVTGISAAISVGSVVAVPGVEVPVTGVELSTDTGSPLITAWSNVDPNVTNTWTNVNEGVTNTWTNVNEGVTNTWTEVDIAA